MKILIVNTLYSPYIRGGAEIICQEQAEGLQNLGYDVTVVTTTGGKNTIWENINGVEVCRIPLKNVYWHFNKDKASSILHKLWHVIDIYNFGMKYALAEVVAKKQPDVAICHNLAGFSVSAWDVLKRHNIPIIQVLHDQYLLCPNSNAFKDGRACNRQCTICKTLRLIHPNHSKKVDAVVGVSAYVLNRLIQFGYFKGVTSTVIHNARSFPNTPKPQDWKQPEPLRIGYIGTLSKVKGVEWLIRSFMSLNIKAELVIAGKGETSDYEQYLKDLAVNDKRIRFTGYTRPENHYTQIDLSVVPSLWPDTFPTVAFESCAYHVPVIATAMGGLPEIIKDGVNGLLIDPNNEKSLSDAIMRIYNDSSILPNLSTNCRPSAQEFMDKDRVLSQYVQILHDMTSERYKN